jgi:hypothetical protein
MLTPWNWKMKRLISQYVYGFHPMSNITVANLQTYGDRHAPWISSSLRTTECERFYIGILTLKGIVQRKFDTFFV